MAHDPFLDPPSPAAPLDARTAAEVNAALEAACAGPGGALEDLIEEAYALGLRRGSPEVARAAEERAAKLGGEDAETLRAVARVAAASGDLALAAEAAERAPHDEAIAAAHAEVLAVLDQPADALGAIERFLEAGRAPADAVRR